MKDHASAARNPVATIADRPLHAMGYHLKREAATRRKKTDEVNLVIAFCFAEIAQLLSVASSSLVIHHVLV